MTEKPKGKRPANGNEVAIKEAAAKKAEAAAKKNDAIAAAVKEMNTLDQSNLLSQALLREYMHRKGYKNTLAVFDSESPRTDTTISSRQLMGSLMELQTIQDRNQQREVPMGTMMEILCSYRLRKRGIVAAKSEGTTSADYDSSDEEREVTRLVVEGRQKLESTKEEIARALEQREAKPAKKKKAKKTEEVEEEGGAAKAEKKKKKAKKSKEADVDNIEEDDPYFVPSTKTQKQPKRSAASYNRSANDILKDAMGALSTLPLTSSARSGTSYARGWTPGTIPSQDGDGAPQVGLSQSHSPDRSAGADDEPHSFLAGDAMGFSFNQQRLSLDRSFNHISPVSTPTQPHTEEASFTISPRTSVHASPSATRPVGNMGSSPASSVSAAQLLGHQHQPAATFPSPGKAATTSKRQGMSFAAAMAQAVDKDTGGVSPSNSLTGRHRRQVTIIGDE